MTEQATIDGEKTANLHSLVEELADYARGMKALDAGNVTAAQASSDQMDASLWRMQQRATDEKAAKDRSANEKAANKDQSPTEELMPDALPDPLLQALSVQSLELRAGILVVQGRLEEAKKLYAAAQAEEKRLGYHEPPMYIRPVGETEAAALLKAKDYAGAQSSYEIALAERPNSGFGLYGLARVKELQGDLGGAREAYVAFLKAWAHADQDLAEIAHAKQFTSTERVAAK
jgi:tetratricopeptide (TPR) repeat protein